MSWNSLPEELKQLPQWVGATANKLPINPKTGKAADVSDPSTWGTFEQACSCGSPHIGFVFTEKDDYVFIDLDTGKKPDKAMLHTEIVIHANSYTETSVSGKSSHIVVKGKLKGGIQGLRDDDQGIEVYNSGRHMLATGWVYHGFEIRENQELLDYLVEKIQGKRVITTILTSQESALSDEQIWERAANAENGDKFRALFDGNWQSYPEYKNDHSRADLALCTFFDFYTKDVDQVIRLFKFSKLYRPGEKGRAGGDGHDYITRTLKQARARNEADQPPQVDATVLAERALKVVQNSKPFTNEGGQESKSPRGVTLPPGLIGEVAQHFYNSSIRPVPEIALMAALGLMSGIVGRQFNISGSGLNLYLIVLASTGTGKEGAGTAISSLMARIRETIPAVDQFAGPSDFMSGPAVIKTLDKQPCFYSVIGEIGLRIQQMADPRSNGAEKTLQRALLNLYSKSGFGQTENSSAYSDREKNTSTLYSPALTIFGDSQPETFFNNLSETHIMSGLLPRFSFMEYTGKRPPRNKVSAFCPPPPALVSKMADLCAQVVQMQANNAVCNVYLDQGAQALLDRFDEYADDKINNGTELYKQLWNRAHLKALRISGVLAVSVNPNAPIVDIEIANWAIQFTKQDIETIEKRFQTEEVGVGEHRYESEVRKAVSRYLRMDRERRKTTYAVPDSIIKEPIIPYTYLRRCLRQVTSFKEDRRGATIAIQATLKDMVDASILTPIPPLTRKEKYGLSSEIYVIGDSW